MKLLNPIKEVFTNKLGWFLVMLNFTFALWGFIEKEGNINSFHFYYEPLTVKILSIINFPAIIFAGIIEKLFFGYKGTGASMIEISDFAILLVIIFSCIQWLLFGYFFNSLYRNISNDNSQNNN